MFHYVVQTDHKLVKVSLQLVEVQYLLTRDKGLQGPARIPSSVGISGGGYQE